MALSLSAFRTRFPEFNPASDAMVSAKLAEAEDDLDTTVWGDQFDKGHGWLTAHLLAESGHGQGVNKDGTTNYGRRFGTLAKRVGRAYRLVLD